MTIRVLIVDDSSFFTKQLTTIISEDPQLKVVGTARNGAEGVEQARLLQPDIITMDLEMPIMNGVDATKKIMSTTPRPILILSEWSSANNKATLDALDAGAIDYMSKKFEDSSMKNDLPERKLRSRLKKLALTIFSPSMLHGSGHQPIKADLKDNNRTKPNINKALDLIVIGTSTGGPIALQKVLTKLPANFAYPILLIQHMPGTFTPSFAERLNAQCNIDVKHAETGDILSAGHAYLAPGGSQMLVSQGSSRLTLDIDFSATNQSYKPCIDLTLESLLTHHPQNVLVIILTGMGSDGLQGCQKLKTLGATIWVQNEQSSTIYGMPKVVADAGIADRVLDISEIGQQLMELD